MEQPCRYHRQFVMGNADNSVIVAKVEKEVTLLRWPTTCQKAAQTTFNVLLPQKVNILNFRFEMTGIFGRENPTKRLR